MGTRADFYIGKGEDAEWLGSFAWDGYPEGNPEEYGVMKAESENSFREAVENMREGEDHFTIPSQGWPWPWDNSHTTDYAYTWDGKVWSSCYGQKWTPYTKDLDSDEYLEGGEKAEVPDMSARKNVTFGNRSGVIVVTQDGIQDVARDRDG